MSSNCHRQRLRPELRWKRPPEWAERAELALVSLLERMGPGRPLELEHWRRSRLALVRPPKRLAVSLQTQRCTVSPLAHLVAEQSLALGSVPEEAFRVSVHGPIL